MITNKKQAIEALQLAKPLMWNGSKTGKSWTGGKNEFVCLALRDVYFNNRALKTTINEIEVWINKQIGDSYTACTWLESQGVVKPTSNKKKLQKWRLAWIDHMIKTLKQN